MSDEKNEQDFQQFKAWVNTTYPTLAATEPPTCVTDTTLRRFFTARRCVVADAQKQYTAYREWAQKINLASLSKAKPPSEKTLGKLYCFLQKGVDKEQAPIYIERLGACHMPSVRQLVHPEKDFAPYYAWKNEQDIKNKAKLSEEHKADIHKTIVICDMAGLGMQHRFGMDYFAVSAGIDEKYYPETVKKVFCVNVPWVFPAVFAIAKAFIDKDTVEKIEILSGGVETWSKRLLEVCDADQLPVEYGGTATWVVPKPQHDALIAQMEKQMEEMEGKLSLESVDISARGKHEVKLEVKEAGKVEWFLTAGTSDIDFSVTFSAGDGSDAVEAHPPEKKKRSYGSFVSNGAGTATLNLSNTGLMWGKTVKYCFWVAKP